tara:strand:- start:82 stop:345 length:264 start_codon:yes stop_codon:yes gene_type:complete
VQGVLVYQIVLLEVHFITLAVGEGVQRDGLQELVGLVEMVAVEMVVNMLVQLREESTAQMGWEEEVEVRQNHILHMTLVEVEMVAMG